MSLNTTADPGLDLHMVGWPQDRGWLPDYHTGPGLCSAGGAHDIPLDVQSAYIPPFTPHLSRLVAFRRCLRQCSNWPELPPMGAPSIFLVYAYIRCMIMITALKLFCKSVTAVAFFFFLLLSVIPRETIRCWRETFPDCMRCLSLLV